MPTLIPTDRPIIWRVKDDGSHGTTRLAEVTAVSQFVTHIAGEGEQAFLDAVVADGDAYPALPRQGTELERGEIYDDGGTLVMVRQSHTRTEHDPADVPALFLVWRADAGDVLEWVVGEQVYVGTLRIYDGTTYECIQAHVTQRDWTPPSVPALWQVYTPPGGTDEWAAGVAYTGDNTAGAGNGDVVTYQGSEYRCLQSHTSQPGWEPPNVPALWMPL